MAIPQDDTIFLEAANQLKEATRLGRSFEAAQVKVIGLDEIRSAAGNNWTSLGGRIRSNSMRFLQDRLGGDDMVIPAGDGFLVIYAQTPDRDFEAETAAMQASLNTFYLGDEATKSLAADVKHTRVDPRGLVSLIGNVEGPALVRTASAPQREIAILPVWNVKQEAITGYWVAPAYKNALGRVYGYDRSWAEPRVNFTDDYLSCDLAILARAIQEAERCLASGRRCLLGYSVHSSTLQNRQRRLEFLNSLYTAADYLRPYLVGRIAEIAPGTPTVTIAEWVHLLRPVSTRVTIQIHENDSAVTDAGNTGAAGVSLTLSSRQMDPEGQDFYTRHIQRWAAALQRQKVQFRIDNIIAPELLTLAISSGADALTSERIWPVVGAPGGVILFSRSQLLETFLRTA
jgi:hypothetical protein